MVNRRVGAMFEALRTASHEERQRRHGFEADAIKHEAEAVEASAMSLSLEAEIASVAEELGALPGFSPTLCMEELPSPRLPPASPRFGPSPELFVRSLSSEQRAGRAAAEQATAMEAARQVSRDSVCVHEAEGGGGTTHQRVPSPCNQSSERPCLTANRPRFLCDTRPS